ncbi:MAG TPA: alpha/beta fold hydrolase [Solirubrobacterales bacterium]|nr:alpha/beta fold hydrolase [Solirubrobacterales bacterium]
MSTVRVDGREVAYDLVGSGPTVVLCHSLGGERGLWGAQLEALANERRVLAYDMRGHGGSGLGSAAPSLGVLAADLVALLGALAIDRAHVVGQSIGAMTALRAAIDAPARLASCVALDCIVHADPAWDARYEERAALVEREGVAPLAAELAVRSLGASSRERDPGLAARYAALLAAAPRTGYAWACRAMIGLDLRAGLPGIERPVLVAAGDEDELTTPAEAAAIAAAIPGAELASIAGSGHVPCLERPEDVTELIRRRTAEAT